MTRYFVRLDDVHAGSDFALLQRIIGLVPRGVPIILGLVPENRDPELGPRQDWQQVDVRWLIELSADRQVLFAQHGTHHILHRTTGNLLSHTRVSEFSGRQYEDQLQLIRKGKQILQGLGLEVSGFMPPGHGFDYSTIRACKAAGLRTIFDGIQRFPFLFEGVEFIPCLTEKAVPLVGCAMLSTCYHVEKAPLGRKELSRLSGLRGFKYCRSTKELDAVESKPIAYGLKMARWLKGKLKAHAYSADQ